MAIAPVTTSSPVTTSTTNQIPTVPFRPPALVLPESISKDDKTTYSVITELGRGNSIVIEVLTPREKVHHLAMKLSLVKKGEMMPLKDEAAILKSLTGVRHILKYIDDFDVKDGYNIEGDKLEPTKDKAVSHAILTEIAPPDAYIQYIEPILGKPTILLASNILTIGKQLLETLSDLHAKKLVYLDLKPDNIAIDPSTGKVTLLDFGCARSLDSINPEEYIGTLPYRAPEQMVFKPYGASVDMWALGMVLFQLYTGFPLINSEGSSQAPQTVIDCLHLLIKTVGKLPSNFHQSVPKELQYFFRENGSLAWGPSKSAEEALKYFNKVAKFFKFPPVPIWKLCIHIASHKKKDNKRLEVQHLINLLSKIIRYDNRITAQAALDEFFFEPTEIKNLKI